MYTNDEDFVRLPCGHMPFSGPTGGPLRAFGKKPGGYLIMHSNAKKYVPFLIAVAAGIAAAASLLAVLR
jgi:hypothetical protein